MNKQDIIEFIKNKDIKLCVLATVTKNNRPECAVVGYAAKEDGTIIMNANKHTRKVANIKENNNIAIAIGWDFTDRNVQYEGVAEVIERHHPDFSELENFFFSTNPQAKKFESPDTILIRIKPAWMRMLDLTVSPPSIEEMTV